MFCLFNFSVSDGDDDNDDDICNEAMDKVNSNAKILKMTHNDYD